MTIMQSARFAWCQKCGLHGRIVLSDGTEDTEVFSAINADSHLRKFAAKGKITPEEVVAILHDIKEWTKVLFVVNQRITEGVFESAEESAMLAEEAPAPSCGLGMAHRN